MRPGARSTLSGSSSHSGRSGLLPPISRLDKTPLKSQKPLDMQESCTDDTNNSPRMKKGETIQIITKDSVRTLRIPQFDPSEQSIILPSAEFVKITSKSRFLTKEDREALKNAREKEREEETKATEARKLQIKSADMYPKKDEGLTDLEAEDQKSAQHLVDRANALKMEQEDEIKQLNQLILGAKCQAIRDIQIQETKQIQAELAEEEKRLNTMMELERRKALERADKNEEECKKQRIRGNQQICNQIQERLEKKLIQDELKEQEKQRMREEQERQNLKELKALEEKKMKQQLLQEEIMRINSETTRAKEKKLEEEKLADMRDFEYQLKIQERQAEREAQQARLKKEKELEIARLRAQQERARDYKAEQDELRARRSQAIAERKWRMKERELAVKKARDQELLKAARLEQVQNREHCLAVEAGREKATMERVLKAQQEAIDKEKEEEEKQQQRAFRHAEAIRQQVKQQELSAVAKRREIFKEGEQLAEKEKQRRMCLEEVKEKKLKELKATGILEKYCIDVERKAQRVLSAHKRIQILK